MDKWLLILWSVASDYLSIPKLQRLHRWCLEWTGYVMPHFTGFVIYLSMLGLKLNHVNKRGPRCLKCIDQTHGGRDKGLHFANDIFIFIFFSGKFWIHIRFNWNMFLMVSSTITHWGRVTHICDSKLTSVGSDNGLSPGRRQAIIWTNAGILLIGPLGTNFNENLFEIHIFSFKKMHLKMSSGKWRPFCLGLNVLSQRWFRLWLGTEHVTSQYLNQSWCNWRVSSTGRTIVNKSKPCSG